ncbi:hypothetical protein NDI49_19385 [Trichocoleus sp. ST-U3]
MPAIDFQHIRPLNSSPEEAFEELCCQIFRRLLVGELPTGSQFHRFRGAGGDGGVEAIWILPSGEKLGLQAKYFNNLTNNQLKQMTDSLQTAKQNHPELTRYIICLPFTPTGPVTGGQRGQSQTEKLENWKQKRLEELAASGTTTIELEFWTASLLQDYLLAVDPQGGLRRYWFDSAIMTTNWLQQRLEDAKGQAGQRYCQPLSVKVPAFDALEAFACADSWQQRATEILNSLHQGVKTWQRQLNDSDNLPESCRDLVPAIAEQLLALENELSKTIRIDEVFDLQSVVLQVDDLIKQTTQVEQILFKDFCNRYGAVRDTPGFRQFEAEYNCHFPAAGLDRSRDLLKCLEQIDAWLEHPEIVLPRSPFMLLRGSAGVGKTHAIVDHALHGHSRGQVCLVFFGEDFTGADPWEIIASKLGLSGTISRDELWEMINAAAESTGKPALIYIDALNESDKRQRWKQSWLPTLRQQIVRFPWLKLCVSCRDTYLDEVLEDNVHWPEFLHNGFIGREFDAIRQFFEFYELQPAASPLLQPEFANPLFLHLVCDGLKGAGIDSLPLGTLGFTDILRLLLEKKNQNAAQVCRYDSRDEKINQAVDALARRMAENNTRSLPLNVARETVNAIFSVDDHTRSLFSQLEKEGLISLIERRARPLGAREWFCRFTFERVADFLIALSLIESIEPTQIQYEFQQGSLTFAVSSDEAAKEYRGLLEAWSIILPERFGIELVDVAQPVDRYSIVLPTIFSGFQWRAIESFSVHTRELVFEGLANPQSCPAAMDALMGIAAIPEHPLCAELIDELLQSNDLTTRDPFWCHFLYEDFEKQGTAWRLIEWALRANLASFSDATAYLWALILSWCCAASDRRVRDRATKGLTRLFLDIPSIIKSVLARFAHVDDDYVLERVSLAAYSSVLCSENDNLLRDLANFIYTEFFVNGLTLQNALIRDWLRLILELAHRRNLLDAHVSPECFRPPYDSSWPIEFPTEEEVTHLVEQDAFEQEMTLYNDGFGTDFARYILDSLLSQYDLEATGIMRDQIYRWFVQSVSELGYPGSAQQCYHYDRYILSKHGGGRSKPVWAERLGKKYYWILLQRLAGILADHLPKELHRWERKPSCSRLQGINLRDIDPTDLREYFRELPKSSDWWQPVYYDFNVAEHLEHGDWIQLEDFPDFSGVLQTNDLQGDQWFHLSLYSPMRKVMSQVQGEKYPYRDLAILLETATVPCADVGKIRRNLRTQEFSPYLACYKANDYRLLLREYPNTLAVEQQLETREISLDCDIPGTQDARMTTIELMRGREFEYDCSQDKPAPHLLVPTPGFLEFRSLQWDGQSSWHDVDGMVQVIAIDTDVGQGLLIRLPYLQDYLTSHLLSLICIGYQEKVVITQGMDRFGLHEVRSVFAFDGNRLKLLDRFAKYYPGS